MNYLERLQKEIDELKQMQLFPRFYLSKYFGDMKTQVDFALKLDDKDSYLKIINNIESFEQDVYMKWNSNPINTYDNDIKLIEEKLNSNLYVADLIEKVKFEIEKTLFSNKTILFINEKSWLYKRYRSNVNDPFLLIIMDEFISSTYHCESLLTTYELNEYILIKKLKNTSIKSVVSLVLGLRDFNSLKLKTRYFSNSIKELDPNIFKGLVNLKKIDFSRNYFKKIHGNSFNGLINIKNISFNSNRIGYELDPLLFKGLANLKKINFSFNRIDRIHEKLFKDLAILESIQFRRNEIRYLHPELLNGLSNLNKIDLSYNKLYEIPPNLFNGLLNLKEIYFRGNSIRKIDSNLFNRLSKLKKIDFSYNRLEELDPNIFNGLISLKKIDLNHNLLEDLHPNLFDGLLDLKHIDFGFNQIREIDPNLFNGLNYLMWIDFKSNYIKELNQHHQNKFNCLHNLKIIDFSYNFIKENLFTDKNFFINNKQKQLVRNH